MVRRFEGIFLNKKFYCRIIIFLKFCQKNNVYMLSGLFLKKAEYTRTLPGIVEAKFTNKTQVNIFFIVM